MKRLEFVHQRRKSPLQSRGAADAVMMLAQITLERRRLQQERASLEKRLLRIDGRLHAIAGAETRLLPTIQISPVPSPKSSTSLLVPPVQEKALSPGLAEVVMQY